MVVWPCVFNRRYKGDICGFLDTWFGLIRPAPLVFWFIQADKQNKAEITDIHAVRARAGIKKPSR